MFLRPLASVAAIAVACAPQCSGEIPATKPEPAIPQRLADAVKAFAQFDHHQQAEWIKRLFADRSVPALRAGQSASELTRQQARHQAILDRLNKGRHLSTAGLAQLLAEVDAQERLAISRLWRDLEFSTAQAFHNQRSEFEKRMDARREVLRRWNGAGQPWEEQDHLLTWLVASVDSQRRTPQLALPALPDFHPAAKTAVAKQPLAPPAAPPIAARRPAASASPPRARTAQTTPKPAARPGTFRPATSSHGQSARVDTSEFRARLTGYNLAVTELVSQLQDSAPWTVSRLESTLDTLAELTTVNRDLSLYWNLVPARTRELLPELQSLSAAVSLFSEKTAAARHALEGENNAQAHRDLVRLDRVSRRLAELAVAPSQ